MRGQGQCGVRVSERSGSVGVRISGDGKTSQIEVELVSCRNLISDFVISRLFDGKSAVI